MQELDNAIREEEERKKLEEEKKERETTGQALVEAAKGGKLPEITSILTRLDAQDIINYMHEGRESARCKYAASSVWWAARYGHLNTLEALIAAGADVNLAPRLLRDAVPASVRIKDAVGEKAARPNGVYDEVIDVNSYVQLNGKPVFRKRDDPDTWLFFNTEKFWVIGTTADKEANSKSCLWKGCLRKCEKCEIFRNKGTTNTTQCAGHHPLSNCCNCWYNCDDEDGKFGRRKFEQAACSHCKSRRTQKEWQEQRLALPPTEVAEQICDLVHEPSRPILMEGLEEVIGLLRQGTPISWLRGILAEELWEEEQFQQGNVPIPPGLQTVWDQLSAFLGQHTRVTGGTIRDWRLALGDKDCDGRLTREEYKSAFHLLDADKDGKITKEEFNCVSQVPFVLLDIDGDGFLSRTEYEEGFDVIDTDKDLSISRLEFQSVLRKNYGAKFDEKTGVVVPLRKCQKCEIFRNEGTTDTANCAGHQGAVS